MWDDYSMKILYIEWIIENETEGNDLITKKYGDTAIFGAEQLLT